MNNQRNIVYLGEDEEMEQDLLQDESIEEDYGVDDQKKKKS